MIKKGKLIVSSLISVLIIRLVSAYSGASFYIEEFIMWLEDTFGVFFSYLLGYGYVDELLFARILLFILVFAIVFSVLVKSKVLYLNS